VITEPVGEVLLLFFDRAGDGSRPIELRQGYHWCIGRCGRERLIFANLVLGVVVRRVDISGAVIHVKRNRPEFIVAAGIVRSAPTPVAPGIERIQV